MLSFIFRILFLAFIIWLVRFLLALFTGSAKRSGGKNVPKGAANYMVKDPVCGMYMDSRLAIRLQKSNETFYFCSEECKKKFLDKPSEGNPSPEANR
jgi:uncharacterized protein